MSGIINTTIKDIAAVRRTVQEFSEFLVTNNIILVYSVHQDIPAVPNVDRLISEFISRKLTAVFDTKE